MLPLIRRHTLLAAFMLTAAAGPGWAQSDPPDRVARLNYLSGQVSFRPASLEEWGVATINYPLTTGDHLWVEPNAAAELHVGSAVIRLASETAFSFLNLDNDVVQARLAEGTLDLRVREILEGETYEVDTPNAAVSILRAGIYHIDVDPEGERTRVTVREGEAEIDGNGRPFPVRAGQMAEIIGVEDVAYDVGRAPSPDRWELWCRERDRREDRRLALNYVSRDMVGYEDLDDYGTWSYVPEYGYGWEPTVVAVDWAPYRYGHWSWVRRWGWTWIDDARWGFAPTHYGRWMCYRNRWIWLPGHREHRPVWAPALVAFVGNRNWQFSFAAGSRPAIGWFPLGPGEFYCPSYPVSPRYLRNVNARNVDLARVNVTTINVAQQRYTNRNVAGAMTAVPRDMFVAAQSVQRVGTAVPREIAANTPVLERGVSATPGTASVLGHIPAAAARPPASVMRRVVVARTEPPASVTQAAPVMTASRRPLPNLGRSNATDRDVAQPDVNRGGSIEAQTMREAARPANGVRPRTDQGNAADNTYYAWPQNARSPAWSSTADRPATSVRPRSGQSADSGRITEGRATEATQPEQSAPNTDNQSAARPRPQTPTYVAPRYDAPTYRAPTYEAPRYQYQAPSAREDRTVQPSERVAPRDDRPALGRSEPSAPPSSARPRGEERSQERSAAPVHGVAAPASSASPAAPAASRPAERPAERAAERPQPQSGGQSSGSARPRGGRGGH